MFKLPYSTQPPAEKFEKIGTARTGTMKIRSIAAFSKPEMEFYKANSSELQPLLAKRAREVHKATDRKHKFADVWDTMKAPLVGEAPVIEEIADQMNALKKEWEDLSDRNECAAAVAIMRQRIPGFEAMTIEQFQDEAIVPPAMQRLLKEFAYNEKEGWPNEKAEAGTDEAKPTAPTEEEAGK